MMDIKTPEEIEVMKKGGQRLRTVVKALLNKIEAGMTTKEVDLLAEKLIKEQGGEPSFKKVDNYFWSTCLPINEQVVHTPPMERELKVSDVLTLDIGMYFEGYHTDFATSFVIGNKANIETVKFLEVGKKTLQKAINQARVGKRLGHISEAIQTGIEGAGYHVMRELTGHGIGKELHEDPYVFGYLDRPIDKTSLIKPGLTIAVEVIYAKGTENIKYEKGNDWSIVSADRSLTACFEHTIAITEKGTLILT